jgi:fucose 4-O-acetylase-like acetyltransferase
VKLAEEMRQSLRDPRFDIIKGVCILLMVWAHLPSMGLCEDGLFVAARWIYTFHIPVFCLITGWFFGRKTGVVKEVIMVLQRMLKPYLTASIISITLYWVAAQMHVETSVSVPFSWRGVCGILGGYGGGALWYLYTFGIAQLLTLIAISVSNKTPKRNAVIESFFVILITGTLSSVLQRFGLNVWAHFVPYFIVGFIASRHSCCGFELDNRIVLVAGGLICLVSLCYGYTMPYHVSFLFVISIFCVMFKMAERLTCVRLLSQTLQYIGRNTLEILIFHNIVSAGIRPLSKYVLLVEPSGVGLNVCMMLIVVAVSLFVGQCIRKTKMSILFYSK